MGEERGEFDFEIQNPRKRDRITSLTLTFVGQTVQGERGRVAHRPECCQATAVVKRSGLWWCINDAIVTEVAADFWEKPVLPDFTPYMVSYTRTK